MDQGIRNDIFRHCRFRSSTSSHALRRFVPRRGLFEMAFKIASSMAFKDPGPRRRNPSCSTVFDVEVVTPEYMGERDRRPVRTPGRIETMAAEMTASLSTGSPGDVRLCHPSCGPHPGRAATRACRFQLMPGSSEGDCRKSRGNGSR